MLPATCNGHVDVAIHELQMCSQDGSANVSDLLKEARSISQAFAAVAEGGARQLAKYKALLQA